MILSVTPSVSRTLSIHFSSRRKSTPPVAWSFSTLNNLYLKSSPVMNFAEVPLYLTSFTQQLLHLFCLSLSHEVMVVDSCGASGYIDLTCSLLTLPLKTYSIKFLVPLLIKNVLWTTILLTASGPL